MTNDRQVRAIAEALCTKFRVGHMVPISLWERPCSECLGLAYGLVGVLIVPHALTEADVQGLAGDLEHVTQFLRRIGDTEL